MPKARAVSRQIKDGQVMTADLADASVTLAKLASLTTKGDLLAHTGAAHVRQGIGSTGQILVTDPAQTNGMAWVDPPAPRANKFINGNFDVWQAAPVQSTPSWAAIANATHTADMWKVFRNGAGAWTVSRDSSVPTGGAAAPAAWSMKALCTTADTSISGEYFSIAHSIEGYALQAFKDKTVTLSFWVNSSKTGAYSIRLANAGLTRFYRLQYTIVAANTWEKKAVTFTHNSTGSWNYTNGLGMIFEWCLVPGSTGAAGTWGTDGSYGVAGDANVADTVNATWFIAQVQLESGSIASPFALRSFPEEFPLCQRYYQRTYPPGIDAGNGSFAYGFTVAFPTADPNTIIRFPIEMRTAAGIQFYAQVTGTANNMYDVTAGANVAVAGLGGDANGYGYLGVGAITAFHKYGWNHIADARL